LLDEADSMKKQGLSEKDIATGLGITTTQLRDLRTIVRNERQQDQIHMAQKLKDKGLSNGAIAIRMREAGYKVNGESQVRALLQPSQARKVRVLDNVTTTLRDAVNKKEFLDVGAGVEYQLNITSTKLRSALQNLKNEGYNVFEVKVEQLGTGNQTNMKVLTKPENEWGDVQRNRHNIQQLQEYSENGGLTSLGMVPPLSVSSKRIGVRYADQGGAEADGVMYVRDGVSDLSLGRSRYAQVRVMVDDSHYLKGMAIKVDGRDLPDGVDILFNTNKNSTGNKLDAMKELKKDKEGNVDQDNPFGSTVRQIGERDQTGKITKLTSAMNVVNEEGKWDEWSKSLSSQFLSKQRPTLAKEQLDLTYTKKKTELDSILALTNPSVKKKLLESYADGVDSSAVHLKAAHLPRQKTQVIMPVNDMKPTEVYAPNFRDGERVALVRFPHGGTFEIPELTVNNRNPAAKKLLGDSKDAIGIHSKVAERLSGADFDGDNVLVIPNNLGKIKSTSPLEGLRNFDPKSSYPPYEGMKRMTDREKGYQMGLVSNLITDMTIQRASTEEIARAVRHSMVVIDAEKHNLDWRRSRDDNGIPALMKRYQGRSLGGARTLISRATSPEKVDQRKPRSASKGGPIDPKTGKKVFEPTGRMKSWVDEKGKTHVIPFKTETTKLAEADNAHTLSSGTVIEKVYADHSNKLKSLANAARKELVSIKSKPYSPSAKRTHASAVETLNAKLSLALRNAPLERQAQVFANATVRLKIQANPSLREKENKAELKRVKSQALSAARARTGAEKQKFDITDSEWAAIQAGAITAHKLDQILNHADLDRVKELATPRAVVKMTTAKESKARSLHAQGYTWAEIADSLGVSVSTVQAALKGEGD
jgi:transcriptional regulator with XRE-family HTH domain